jgi:hypothetical protein
MTKTCERALIGLAALAHRYGETMILSSRSAPAAAVPVLAGFASSNVNVRDAVRTPCRS